MSKTDVKNENKKSKKISLELCDHAKELGCNHIHTDVLGSKVSKKERERINSLIEAALIKGGYQTKWRPHFFKK
jgi:hypothetical protein